MHDGDIHPASISRTQRGFLLITAVVLIVTVGLLAAVITFLTTGNVLTSASHASSAKALFVAESGMERAIYGFSEEGTGCTALVYAAGVGEGSFSTTGTLYTPVATTLSAAISATDSIIPVASVAGYAPHGRAIVGSESLNYTGSSTSSCGAFSPPCLTGAARGVGGSTAAAHALGTAVSQSQCLIRSIGTVGSGKRTVDRAVSATSGSTSAIIVYAKETSPGIPFYRFWDNTTATWGAEQSASSVGGGGRLIEYIVVKSARTRNEMILGTLDSTGDIRIQIWNGSNWSDGTTIGATRLMADVGGNDNYRGFDIAYETGSDRAIVVYNNANNRNPAYQIWDGTSWSAAVSLNTPLGGNYTTSNNPPIWIDLAADPRTGMNNLVLMTLDSANGVYGVAWNGTTWARMSGATAVWGLTAVTNQKPIDVAYEQLSGRAMFAWGTANSGTNQQQYRIWNSSTSTLGGIINLDISTMNNTAQWIRLASQPNTDNLMFGVQDSGRDLHTLFWNGGAFGSETRHDTSTEAGTSRNFDIAFETFPANAGQAWLVWGTSSGSDQVRRRHWNGGGWDAVLPKIGDDTGYVRVAAHPVTGAVFSALYQTNGAAARDIQEVHLTNGSATWSAIATIWNGGTVGNPVMQRVDMAPTRAGLTLYDWIEVFP